MNHIIKKEIRQQGFSSISHFSKVSGINRGVLSATLNEHSPKSISIQQLDQMSKALHKPPGWLYDEFLMESFPSNDKLNWRKLKPFLVRCIQLNRTANLHALLDRLASLPGQLNHIFELAEELVQENDYIAIRDLYETIIRHEKDHHSEKLAISHYRIFNMEIGLDLEKNYRVAISFEPFYQKLPIHLKLDALLQLAFHSYILQDWERVKKYAVELHQLSRSLYEQLYTQESTGESAVLSSLLRPLVVYYGQSYLLRFCSLELEGKYEEARQYLEPFRDLSWFRGLDEAGKKEVHKFSLYAKFNEYNLELLQGNQQALPRYLKLMEEHPLEILPSLFILLKASNIHYWNIDPVLAQYEDVIYPADMLESINIRQSYTAQADLNRHVHIYYQLALYHLNRGKPLEQLDVILSAMEETIKNFNNSRIVDCLALLHKLQTIPKMETK
ncbi:DNA-binding protein [Paenibacillus bovis]|uniref:DNA-binding protein n=1 Tax=Paenibacillus bovis TaxID=1616788 RepID=UPI0011AB890A|nr:DNA-binding protein [Paenibacillus bovis]